MKILMDSAAEVLHNKTGNSDWKKFRQWIICTGISMEHKNMLESDDLLEFAESLRDGVILCAIVNKMKPGCLEYRMKVNNVDEHEFLCKRNIDLFLRACHNVFHIEEEDLFTAADLYHLLNFKAVILTLSILSNKEEATDILEWTPFYVGVCKKNYIRQEEDLYKTLSDIIDQKGMRVYENLPLEENIYDEVEKNCSSIIYDSLIKFRKSPQQQSTTSAEDKTPTKRDHIINEILETEDSYVKNLRTMVESYIPALKSHMTAEDKETVFLNTEKIFAMHIDFQQELSSKSIFKLEKTDYTSKVDISAFIRYKKKFLLYAYYCTNLDASRRRVHELVKHQGFNNAVEELNKKLNRRFPLQLQLAVVFQRILKYSLLLQELKKNTPHEHEDTSTIQDALDVMDDVGRYINEYKRDMEAVLEIKQIWNTLKYDMSVFQQSASILNDLGRHVKDGELYVQFGDNNKREKRFSFLFEHALLLCKAKGYSNEIKEVLDLTKFKLEDTPPIGKGNFSCCLTLRPFVSDVFVQVKYLHIFTKTQQIKATWISAIKKCIQAINLSDFGGKLDNHLFHLKTFDPEKYEDCKVCKKLLLGQISQGYLCSNRGCRICVHQSCLLNCPPCCLLCSSPRVHRSPFGRATCNVVKKREVSRDGGMDITKEISTSGPRSYEKSKASIHHKKLLDTYKWFAGVLSRDQAANMLTGSPDGAFLIRESEKGGLVLSIQFNNKCFHIKIIENNVHVFLTDAMQFPNIDELISYYMCNSIGVSFPTVQTVLTQLIRKPIKRSMVATHKWKARSSKELSFKTGDIISVLNDNGNWWVGISSDDQQGYFPSNYVQ